MRCLSMAALVAAVFVAAAAGAEPGHGDGYAEAGAVCGSRQAALDYLRQRYRERPEARGLAADGRLVELLVAPSGSWTLLISRADGLSCVLATGEAWERRSARAARGRAAERPERPAGAGP